MIQVYNNSFVEERRSILNRKKILLIENKPQLCELYRSELCDEGYEVIAADNGYEVTPQFLEREKPDLVLYDSYTPGMEFLETITLIKTHDDDLPIVAIFEGNLPDINYLKSKVNSFVFKSGDLTELRHQVGNLISDSKVQLYNH